MKIPFRDLIQLSKDHNQIWPQDLADDLEEEEPQILQQSQMYQTLISEQLNPSPKKEIPALPTLVVKGWNKPQIKGTKNWSDFENLLLFYTIGKLTIADTPENQAQKEKDQTELRQVIEEFLPLKGQRKKSAEERVAVNTTYLDFGKRTIDGLLKNSPSIRYELQRELQDARENNYYNALKLERSSDIANRVFETLKNRYQKD